MPVRAFHWLVVVLFAFSWWSAENDQLDWHMLSGYSLLGLVLFRIYWGLVGSSSARFASFIKGPRAVLAYGRGILERPGLKVAGHNPIGGWSVALMLLLLLGQIGLGLFAIDVDGINAGPLDRLVSFETGRQIAHWHGLVFDLLLIATVLHVAAIAFYGVYKRENLIGAMLSGFKRFPRRDAPAELRFPSLWWAAPGLLVAALVAALVARGHL
jgi:cytochrome b